MGIRGACPLATLSNIYIDISSNNTNQNYELVPSPSVKIVSLRGGQLNEIAVYDIRSHSSKGIFNIQVLYNTTHTAGLNYPSILYANRYIIGLYKYLYINYNNYMERNSKKEISFCRIWTRER